MDRAADCTVEKTLLGFPRECDRCRLDHGGRVAYESIVMGERGSMCDQSGALEHCRNRAPRSTTVRQTDDDPNRADRKYSEAPSS